MIGTGRANGRQTVMDFGAQDYIDLENEKMEDVGGVDLVFDIFGGDIAKRSASMIRPGGRLVTIVGPTVARPTHGLTVDFVVEANRAQLSEIIKMVRNGKVRTNVGKISNLDNAVAALNERSKGKTIIRAHS